MKINLKLQNVIGELVFRMALDMANSLYIYKYHVGIPMCCVEVGKMKLDQQTFHDYGFFLISSSQSKSNASSSSSGKVKRDFLERLSFSGDPSN